MLKPFIDSMSVQPQGGQQLFPGQQNSASQVSSSAASSSVPALSTVASSSSSSNKDTDDVKQSSINEQSKQDSHKDRGPSVVYSDSSVCMYVCMSYDDCCKPKVYLHVYVVWIQKIHLFKCSGFNQNLWKNYRKLLWIMSKLI